jgi:hypothetical protein
MFARDPLAFVDDEVLADDVGVRLRRCRFRLIGVGGHEGAPTEVRARPAPDPRCQQ